jgi:predicted enzyme related to lactoylglutathione lyase
VSERSEYTPGTPSWVDVAAPDPDAAAKFYSAIFGWDVTEAGDPEETGGYRMASLRGKTVAGIAPIMGEGQPPSWTTYITTDDADATAEKVKEAGGTVFAEPFDVMEAGRMAVFADPTGAVFAVWQPNQHPGSQLVNEAGTFGWNELNTRDPEAAKEFYAAVFGWRGEKFDMDGGPDYVIWHTDDDQNENGSGGMIDMRSGDMPDEIPPHWLVYFSVDDTDATVDQVKENGGNVAFGPTEIPNVGRFAVVTDPQGAAFAVIKPQPPAEADGESD